MQANPKGDMLQVIISNLMSEATQSDVPSLHDIAWKFQMVLHTDAETTARFRMRMWIPLG
jgi:hypothetical protein